MPGAIAQSAFSRIGHLASLPRVHAAFQWFHLHERKTMQWQQELVSIAAPPFGEDRRAEWLAERFRDPCNSDTIQEQPLQVSTAKGWKVGG